METEKNPLGYKPVGKLLISFSVPAIISCLINSVYNIVDQVFIGQGAVLTLLLNWGYGGKWIDKNEQNIFAYAPVDNQLYQETTRFNVDTGTMGKHGGNDELYKMFGMEEKKEIQIESLSQGQQQRVNIMRAIVKDAEIIILDEPFANLDYSIISQIVNYIRTQKKTVICTLHDRELLQYFDRILRIENGTASEINL